MTIEEQAKLFRQCSQKAGISNPVQDWDDISQARKDQWIRFATAFSEKMKAGVVLADDPILEEMRGKADDDR